MHPYLIDLGERTLPLVGRVHLALPTYGVLVAAALVLGWLWVLKRAERRGVPVDAMASLLFWTVLGGLAGGKLGLVLVELPRFLRDPSELFSFEMLRAAGVIWTAVLGGLLATVLAARAYRLPIAEVVDLVALPLPVCQAIGRLGCLMAGCCYGDECSLPFAVAYHAHEAHERTGVPLGVPLHPAPLYEVALMLALILPALMWLERRQRASGEIALAYLALYGVGRAIIEEYRGDLARGVWFGGALSTSQIISLTVAPIALGLLVWRRARAGREDALSAEGAAAAGPREEEGARAGEE